MRFISEDTFKGSISNPLSLKWYMYCSGNPVGYYDPSGHEEIDTSGSTNTGGGLEGVVIAIISGGDVLITISKGKAWHHIVEQSQISKSGFASSEINNINNIISIPHGKGTVHAKISGFYSSKPDWTNG